MIGRRPLLAGTAAVMAVGALPDAQAAHEVARIETIALWPGTPPGGGGPTGPVQLTQKGAILHISCPYLQIYRPQAPNGAAMLVAGGGGLKHIEMRQEAHPAAIWLAGKGITAFVLVYRLPGEGWADGRLAPLQDVQRAIRLVRAKAKADRLESDRIGVLGFSAGGYLMGLAAEWFAFRSYAPVDGIDFLSARPDNAALIYPVITLQPPYQHTSTALQMLGLHPTAQMRAEWSVQTHVQADSPPIFMVQAKDDPISNPANTLMMQKACEQENVKVVLHQLVSGGHGFGMGNPGTPSAAWPDWYASWLIQQNMINV